MYYAVKIYSLKNKAVLVLFVQVGLFYVRVWLGFFVGGTFGIDFIFYAGFSSVIWH